jgi:hypothetical protein
MHEPFFMTPAHLDVRLQVHNPHVAIEVCGLDPLFTQDVDLCVELCDRLVGLGALRFLDRLREAAVVGDERASAG